MTWRVLVVDADSKLRDAICAQLRRRGVRAAAVGDADAALRVLAAEPVDILITEACLPRRSGLWLLEEVHRRWAGRIPVVLLTGWYPASDQLDAYRAADAVLIKPVRTDVLLTRIAWLLLERRHPAPAPGAPRGRHAAGD
ncbi:MAG TPA: response regulator [Longimicrobiales bacterium]